jgi:hypothetical protein
MPDNLAGGGFDGRDPAQAGEGGLASQPLGVVFKATINSVAAWSVRMPAKETNSGASCATNWSSCASSSAISLSREPGVTASHPTERELGCRANLLGITAEAETGTASDEFLGGKLA